uniref:Uncharacterized protein n=1 Tax=Pararge aegeria TaxID=116150 RepID=S4NXG9_9NEOP
MIAIIRRPLIFSDLGLSFYCGSGQFPFCFIKITKQHYTIFILICSVDLSKLKLHPHYLSWNSCYSHIDHSSWFLVTLFIMILNMCRYLCSIGT